MTIQQLRPLSQIEFGYTVESVEWLEGYIERMRQSEVFKDDGTKDTLVSVFGSFLGECIIRCHGGSWTQREGDWCIAFGDQNQHTAFPLAKVEKQMDQGLEHGISAFFYAISSVWPIPPKS